MHCLVMISQGIGDQHTVIPTVGCVQSGQRNACAGNNAGDDQAGNAVVAEQVIQPASVEGTIRSLPYDRLAFDGSQFLNYLEVGVADPPEVPNTRLGLNGTRPFAETPWA